MYSGELNDSGKPAWDSHVMYGSFGMTILEVASNILVPDQ
jgi:hypothetical protein